jgi:hypothetical protein
VHRGDLHNLLATSRVHRLATSAIWCATIANIGELQRTAAVLVARELGDGRLGVVGAIELDDTSALGAAVGLVLDLGLLDGADRGEEIDEILIAGGPGELIHVSVVSLHRRKIILTLRT